jgi:hypothetical protein
VQQKIEIERPILDTTAQEKAISDLTDIRLLNIASRKLVQEAKRAGTELKLTFEKEGKELNPLRMWLERATCIFTQKCKDKDKLYASQPL